MSTFLPNSDGRVKGNVYENRNFIREVNKMKHYPLIQDIVLNPQEALKRLIDLEDPELISFMIKVASSIPHKVLKTTRSLRVIRAVASQFKNSGYIQHLAGERGRVLIERRKKVLENRKREFDRSCSIEKLKLKA
jgi:hypothetical protein